MKKYKRDEDEEKKKTDWRKWVEESEGWWLDVNTSESGVLSHTNSPTHTGVWEHTHTATHTHVYHTLAQCYSTFITLHPFQVCEPAGRVSWGSVYWSVCVCVWYSLHSKPFRGNKCPHKDSNIIFFALWGHSFQRVFLNKKK